MRVRTQPLAVFRLLYLRPVRHLLFWFCLFTLNAATAQEVSPFDLPDRLPPDVQRQLELRRTNGFRSPFDVPQPGQTDAVVPAYRTETAEEAELDVDYVRERFRRFALTIGLVLGVVLALLVIFFRTTMAEAWRSFINPNLLNYHHRAQRGLADVPLQILHLFAGFAVAFALVVTLYRSGNLTAVYMTYGFYFTVVGAVLGLILLKHLLLKAMGSIYPIGGTTGRYAFLLVVFFVVLGWFAFVLGLGLAFAPPGMHTALIITAVALLVAWLLFRSFRSLFVAENYVFGNFFHFLLYLCAAEIAPVLILARLVAFW